MARRGGKGGVTWTVNDTEWQAGLKALPVVLGAEAAAVLEREVDQGFEEARSTVHVVTGALRDSGRVEKTIEGVNFAFAVKFGGINGVDYGAYEEFLHPFLEPAMNQHLGVGFR